MTKSTAAVQRDSENKNVVRCIAATLRFIVINVTAAEQRHSENKNVVSLRRCG